MVKGKHKYAYLPDGSLDLAAWLSAVKHDHKLPDVSQLNHACELTHKMTQGLTTFYGKPHLEHGLEIAETILNLGLDQESAAVGILSSALPRRLPSLDTLIQKELGSEIAKLTANLHKMDAITELQKPNARNQAYLDKIRKMLLAMATDVRVVIIKLAERLCFLRGIKAIPPEDRQRFAAEILDIYAPLANRLGIGQLKWELEDLAFRYQNPETYKTIANFLAERRTDREKHIEFLISELQDKLHDVHIKAEVQGRAKHIYSIYAKMQRKETEQKNIFDHTAVRILVHSVQDCYKALSIVHSTWSPLMEEFDDYIANPKTNGYQSIHTAVIDEKGKQFEIQIRTYEMHEKAEHGVAAHWIYKEKKSATADDNNKIVFLRQLIDWHKEIAKETDSLTPNGSVFEDQVYVVTPAGDILDMPKGATPIDFAYHVHSDVGHHCRGAKVNGRIVPLTYCLQSGDKVEIHTILEGGPSRDWLNSELGYVNTPRARSKIQHWFKQQALQQDIQEGRDHLEKELARSGHAKHVAILDLARQFNLKNEDELFASVGRGNIRIGQIMNIVQPRSGEKTLPTSPPPPTAKSPEVQGGSAIAGAATFLSRFAKCCKPIPGDAIVGYITQGKGGGITIHKKNCNNVANLTNPARFVAIDWNKENTGAFITDLKIVTHDKEKVLHDLTALFMHEKTELLSFNSNANKNYNKIVIIATVRISHMDHLLQLVHRIKQLPSVIEVMRLKK